MDDGGCLGIALLIGIVIVGVGYFVMVFWQAIVIVALAGFVILIVAKFHEEMKEAIKATGRGIESVLGWAVFEISKKTTREEKGVGLMINQNISLEQLKNSSINWNEQVLRENFQYIAKQANAPILITGYWNFLGQQFDLNRRTRLAEERNKWLLTEVAKYQNLLELLKAAGDLDAFPLEHENRMLTLKQQNQKLRTGFVNEVQEKQIQNLENKRRMSEKELEIARLEKERQELLKPIAEPEKQKTPDEIRKDKDEDLKRKLKKIKKRIKKTEEDESLSPDEKQEIINQLKNKQHDLRQKRLDLI